MNKKPEVIISFSDILYGILRHWRLMIVLTLVGAVAMGGYDFVKSMPSSHGTSIQADYSGLSDAERQSVAAVVQLKQNHAQMLKEYDQSYLVAMDEGKVKVTTLCFYVDAKISSGDYDYTTDLLEAYAAVGVGGNMQQKVLDSVQATASDNQGVALVNLHKEDLGTIVSAECNGRTVIFTIRTNADDAFNLSKVLVEAVQATVEDCKDNLTRTVGAHSLVASAVDSFIGQDEMIADAKLVKRTALSTAKQNASDAYERLPVNLKERADDILYGAQASTSFSVSKKKILLGAAGGFIAAIIIAICHYVWTRKLVNTAELEQTYGLHIFGRFMTPAERHSKNVGKKNSPFSKLDRTILRGQYKLDANMSYEDAVAYTASRVAMMAQDEGFERVCLVSTNPMNVNDSLEKLLNAMNGSQVLATREERADLVQNLTLIREAGAVVLLERMGETKRTALEELLNVCGEQGIEVLGIITLV